MIAAFTHRLIGTDRVDLSAKHDCCEDQKEETLEAEEDEEDDSCWWREVTAFWREDRDQQCSQQINNDSIVLLQLATCRLYLINKEL